MRATVEMTFTTTVLAGDPRPLLDDQCSHGTIDHLALSAPPPRAPDDPGQGDVHARFVVAAHRAVVDVDTELGLVRVVQVDTAQDVGKP